MVEHNKVITLDSPRETRHFRSHHERSHLKKSHHERSHHERSERQLLRINKISVPVESKTKHLIQKMILSISDLVVDLCEAGRAEHGQTSGGIRGLKPSYRIPRVCGEQAEPKGGRNKKKLKKKFEGNDMLFLPDKARKVRGKNI